MLPMFPQALKSTCIVLGCVERQAGTSHDRRRFSLENKLNKSNNFKKFQDRGKQFEKPNDNNFKTKKKQFLKQLKLNYKVKNDSIVWKLKEFKIFPKMFPVTVNWILKVILGDLRTNQTGQTHNLNVFGQTIEKCIDF
jgi:hypothetical protein